MLYNPISVRHPLDGPLFDFDQQCVFLHYHMSQSILMINNQKPSDEPRLHSGDPRSQNSIKVIKKI